MGHYCKICGCIKPNEKFSDKGHKTHVCKECSKIPQEERTYILQEEELWNFLHQSNISKKNIIRLETLSESRNKKIANYALLIFEIAKVKPTKKRRLKYLSENRKDLMKRLKETGLIMACHNF